MSSGAAVVVVGGGVIGLSTARALVERGIDDVLVLEREVVASGGTGRSSGVVRCHYGIRSLAAMAWRSLPVLADAVRILGQDSGYRNTGYLVGVGEANTAALEANVAMHRSLGIDVELVGADAVTELWPGIRLDDMAGWAYEPRGGYGDGHQTALAFAAAARRGGARVRQHAPVASLVEKGGRIVEVELADGERVGADQVVVAAGTWSVALAAGVGVDLPVRAQRAQVLMVEADLPAGRVVPVLSDLVSLQYLRADLPGTLLVGNSDHSDPEWADPDGFAQGPDHDQVVVAVGKFGHRLPRVSGARLTSTYAGCYDVTPDYNPIISATPVDGLVVLAGFSGHGYKISPAVGELAADLVTEGVSGIPDVDLHDFRLARFAEGDPLVSPHSYVGAGQMR